MTRVRIWVSGVPGVPHALLIERDDAPAECYALKNPPSRSARLGAAYADVFEGHAGTYVDLPRGFPADNATAAQRLNDPSIPQIIQQLIRENFPLLPRTRPVPQRPVVQRPAVQRPVAQRPAVQRPVAQPMVPPVPQPAAQAMAQPVPQAVAQPIPQPVAQVRRPADILAEQIRRSRMQDQTSHAG